ncbi:MAG TPA: exodeoxyribonuclease VII small subunit [Candidatus Acidoferrales bacterium]|nr:exodeoxyribonuclease VII small subunit [Candidatus Acidoferrales bacterium]
MSKSKVQLAGNEKAKDDLSFEQALKRLEEIVETLEAGNSPLEESVKLYEEGMALAKSCMTRLNEAKLKLKKIQKKSGGDIEEIDLEVQ